MKRRHDEDEPWTPPRPTRLYWIAAAILAFLVVAGGGIALGASGSLPSFGGGEGEDDESDSGSGGSAAKPCPDQHIDEAAGLCYTVPEGWEATTSELGLGPSSSIADPAADGTAQVHFGPAADIPIDLPGDLTDAVDAVLRYAGELFGAPVTDSAVDSHDIDGHDAVTAATTGPDNAPYVMVTLVDTGDGYGYAMSVIDPAGLGQRADADAVHESITVP